MQQNWVSIEVLKMLGMYIRIRGWNNQHPAQTETFLQLILKQPLHFVICKYNSKIEKIKNLLRQVSKKL
jgi:ribosomal protein L30/L7E